MIVPFTTSSAIVPDGLDATRWDQLKPLYDELLARDLHCVRCLERLILDRSELDAAACEALTLLTINMTCRTDDARANKAYEDFIQHVQPQLKEVGFALDQRIINAPQARELDQQRYGVLLRDLKANVEIFRAENVPIETELACLAQTYAQVSGAMTVVFRGEERTLSQLARYNDETDRSLREEAWRAGATRRYRDAERLDDLFEKMLALRHTAALNAGFANFRDYSFVSKRRFDYSAQTCHEFARGVEQIVTPLARKLIRDRAADLRISSTRPWDTHVDPRGRAPLRPFRNASELIDRTSRVFQRMDSGPGGLAQMFEYLRQDDPHAPESGDVLHRSLDLESRKGKAPGGYQSNRERLRKPFIFMNAAGVQRDVETLLHEAGHAFHSLLCRADPILAYRNEIPLEFAEVASMSMELLTHEYLDEYYTPEESRRACRMHLEQMILGLTLIAIVDQFQHWIYEHPAHSRQERHSQWRAINDRLGPGIDWSGLEEFQRTSWHRILHLYEVPFYYIEYGIAQLGALQIWSNARRDPAATLRAYKQALALGGSRPLPELFAAAGARFEFGPDALSRLIPDIESELARLAD